MAADGAFAPGAAASGQDGGRRRRRRRIAPVSRPAHRRARRSWVYTRNQPRRAEAVLAGGSIYWVVSGQIRVRQRITGFRSERDDNGRAYCLIVTDPELVLTLPRPSRPFQGWRYLTARATCRRMCRAGPGG